MSYSYRPGWDNLGTCGQDRPRRFCFCVLRIRLMSAVALGPSAIGCWSVFADMALLIWKINEQMWHHVPFLGLRVGHCSDLRRVGCAVRYKRRLLCHSQSSSLQGWLQQKTLNTSQSKTNPTKMAGLHSEKPSSSTMINTILLLSHGYPPGVAL